MARQSLESWINEAVNDMDKDGPCWMLSLCHMRSTTPEEISTIKFGTGKAWTAHELAGLMQRKAESYAQDLSGPQTFCLYAFYNKQTEAGAKHPFVIRGQEDFGGLGTEAPDGKGVLQQGMRHTEIALGMALRHQKEVNDQMLTMFKLIGEQNATLLKENIDAMSVVKDVMMAKAAEDSDTRMAQLEYKRKTKERERLLQLAPALANQVFGREIFPQSSADTAIIENITESLDEQQLTQLMAILKPEQAALLAPRMEKAIRDRQAAQLEEHNEMDDDSGDEPQTEVVQ
jgi:hypothetical protein